jgi:hypothetical protein
MASRRSWRSASVWIVLISLRSEEHHGQDGHGLVGQVGLALDGPQGGGDGGGHQQQDDQHVLELRENLIQAAGRGSA